MIGVTRVGAVVVLTGPALRAALECAIIAIRHRRLSGLATATYEDLAAELHAALTAAGHPAVPTPPAVHPELVSTPALPIPDAAALLGLSARQTRRLAPQLGGKLIGGRWLVDEVAVREHQEAR